VRMARERPGREQLRGVPRDRRVCGQGHGVRQGLSPASAHVLARSLGWSDDCVYDICCIAYVVLHIGYPPGPAFKPQWLPRTLAFSSDAGTAGWETGGEGTDSGQEREAERESKCVGNGDAKKGDTALVRSLPTAEHGRSADEGFRPALGPVSPVFCVVEWCLSVVT